MNPQSILNLRVIITFTTHTYRHTNIVLFVLMRHVPTECLISTLQEIVDLLNNLQPGDQVLADRGFTLWKTLWDFIVLK